MNIMDYGWEGFSSRLEEEMISDGLVPGRVITDAGQLYRVVTDSGENWSILSGSLRNSLKSKNMNPAVGDWVMLDADKRHRHWPISGVLPRYSVLTRKTAGRVTEEQVLAANVDYVFLVSGLDGGRNFNQRGLERYLTCGWESGATPVVILNKADLCGDVEAAVLQAEAVAPGVPIHAVSCVSEMGFDGLLQYLSPGATVALIGPSGVGKSSIINALLEETQLDTGPQRQQDLRGRHTTTRRELVKLSSNALLIDTPGLRELQLWGDEASLENSFADIEEYGQDCRFSDCSHVQEPGCAVQQALADGEIEQSRFESYLELRKELKYLKSKQDYRLRKEQQTKWKQIAKFSRHHDKNKRGVN